MFDRVVKLAIQASISNAHNYIGRGVEFDPHGRP